tara:strand:+ start:587 stop:817 length:231 start_codon:yes stop_codon:yes gene_type:complete
MKDEELTLLLKELVNRVKILESTVYNADNVIMKSGLVKIDTPKPSVRNNREVINQDTIAKMDWSEIDELVVKMGSE